MVKCFWCGALNKGDQETCASCDRSLKWSPFLQAILRPSIGVLLGASAGTLSGERECDPVQYSVLAR
ncbi:MAG: hypothetical protein ACPL7O_04430 [Armatimonadota bacterium]